MKFKILIVLAVVLSAIGLSHNAFEASQTSVARNPASDPHTEMGWPNDCVGKAYCITVFVSPTCPFCKGSVTTFKLLQQYIDANRQDVGFGIVTMGADVALLQGDKANLAPIEVMIDDRLVIRTNRKIDGGTPTWIVNNGSSGEQIFNKPGAITVNDISEIPALLAKIGVN